MGEGFVVTKSRLEKVLTNKKARRLQARAMFGESVGTCEALSSLSCNESLLASDKEEDADPKDPVKMARVLGEGDNDHGTLGGAKASPSKPNQENKTRRRTIKRIILGEKKRKWYGMGTDMKKYPPPII